MDQFLLFGDSITQQAFCQERGFAFAAALQDDYIRRLDVVNRGMRFLAQDHALTKEVANIKHSGYNTAQAVKVLPHVIPSPQCAKLRFMTVFFGANDACRPTEKNNQSVPIPQYTANLIKIITDPAVKAHEDVRLILITPPPINEWTIEPLDAEKGYSPARRTAQRTKEYADAAREVGLSLNVTVLDMWSLVMLKAGWEPGSDVLPGSKEAPQNPVLVECLRDGLHLSPAGYQILYDGMTELIRAVWPDQSPGNLDFILPAWDNVQAWKDFDTLETGA